MYHNSRTCYTDTTPQQVTELSELYAHISDLRAALRTAEQTYRTAYRRTTTSGLLTGPQLRTLGLPPIDARRRPPPTPKPPPPKPSPQPGQ